jgi:hypothetical protein
MISKVRYGRYGKIMAGMGLLLFAMVLVASHAQAVAINTGNSNLDVRFDNSVTYSAIFRVADQNETYMASDDLNDSEGNFDKGLVMNRFDLTSELDVAYNDFGVRASGTGWYDFVYNEKNDNDTTGMINHTSVASDEFTDDVETWHGRNAELLDAFTWGAFDMGSSTLRYRVGQFAQQWGTAFFPPFGANSISGALQPLNIMKVTTIPNIVLKEVLMPVPQATVGFQVTDELEIGAIYQFKWEETRLFGSGSYFSPVDFVGPIGSELGPAGSTRLSDVEASDDGQYGIQAKYMSPWNMDFGFYFLNVHSREAYAVMVIDGDAADPSTYHPVNYYFLYPEDIEYYGASVDTNVGNYPLSLEVTYRRNAPLAAAPAVMQVFGQSKVDNDDDPIWPVGQTLHFDISSFSGSNPGRLFCDSYDVILEVGIDHLLTVDKNEDLLDEETKDTAVMAQVHYEPKWYQVFPGWDFYVPIEVCYSPEGRASGMQGKAYGQHHGGYASIGVTGWYNAVWQTGLNYKNFFGTTGFDAWDAPWVDRDIVSFYVTRSF